MVQLPKAPGRRGPTISLKAFKLFKEDMGGALRQETPDAQAAQGRPATMFVKKGN
jgi:hypothetical protein